MKRALFLVYLAAALFASMRCAHAADKLWILTGEGFEDGYYVGGGVLIPFAGGRLGDGWVQRYWLDTFTYTYEAGATTIDAQMFGAEAMVGYHASRDTLAGAIYLGVRYSHGELTPDDPGNEAGGDNCWPKAQAEGVARFAPKWRAEGILSYTFILDGYWTRARLLRDVFTNKYFGPEAVAQGDPTYTARKIGLVFGGMQPFGGVFAAVKAGYRFQSGADSPYIGIELVGQF